MQQIFRHLSVTQLVYVDSYTLSSQTLSLGQSMYEAFVTIVIYSCAILLLQLGGYE